MLASLTIFANFSVSLRMSAPYYSGVDVVAGAASEMSRSLALGLAAPRFTAEYI